MSKIILQPSANKDARIHFEATVKNPVPIDSIAHFLTNYQLADLNDIYPGGSCYIWGVTPGGSNPGKWQRINRGDITLFARNNKIYSSAVTTYKTHNPSLAKHLWDLNSDGETWEYIYFLDEVHDLSIPYTEFNRVVGYDPKYIIQGFNVLDQEKSNRVLQNFNLESDTYLEEVDDDRFEYVMSRLEALEESEKEIYSYQRLEQSYLREHLFGTKSIGQCACCKRELPISLLVTAHIKKRSACSETEKRDPNVVMPLCSLGCDVLFEKGFLVVVDGIFISNQQVEGHLYETISLLENSYCEYYSEHTIPYFEWHSDFHGYRPMNN